MESKIDNETQPRGFVFVLFAVLHLLCCGLPLLILSGILLATLWSRWPPIAGALAILGTIAFMWYLKRGCPTCPRNEARCFRRDTSQTMRLTGRS